MSLHFLTSVETDPPCLQAGLTCTQAGQMARYQEVSTPEKLYQVLKEILDIKEIAKPSPLIVMLCCAHFVKQLC